MRIATIALLALLTQSGCVALHAHLSEEMVRELAREEGSDLGAICSHGGQSYSEGAVACMVGRRMVCDPTGRWQEDGDC